MTTDSVGGVWRYSVDLARALNAAGTRVLLVNVGPEPSDAQRREAAALQQTRLNVLDEKLDWMAARRDELAAIPRRLSRLAEAEGVDLLHLNLPSQACGMQTALPVVAVSHSCVATWWDAMRREALPGEWRWLFDMNREGLQRADRVLAPTQAHADALMRVYGTAANLAIVPNAVERLSWQPQEMREPFVLAAARWWDEGKNAVVLDHLGERVSWPVRAAGACQGGNGQSFGFSHVEALGSLPGAEMRRLMGRAAIFVSPSLYEPFGLAALEAAEAGAALVMADVPTYRELWRDAALFADPRDPSAFADAVEALIADQERRTALATAARDRAAQFTPKQQMRALQAAYRPLAPAHAAAEPLHAS
ncbi:glycosyltransferase [Aurantimonas endophytica]|nr:glycosyltransferase family 4 protein [Aurantimonas endophytica]MCO6405526.1 glycosyltransferase [Aurantimonas endophytica]